MIHNISLRVFHIIQSDNIVISPNKKLITPIGWTTLKKAEATKQHSNGNRAESNNQFNNKSHPLQNVLSQSTDKGNLPSELSRIKILVRLKTLLQYHILIVLLGLIHGYFRV